MTLTFARHFECDLYNLECNQLFSQARCCFRKYSRQDMFMIKYILQCPSIFTDSALLQLQATIPFCNDGLHYPLQ